MGVFDLFLSISISVVLHQCSASALSERPTIPKLSSNQPNALAPEVNHAPVVPHGLLSSSHPAVAVLLGGTKPAVPQAVMPYLSKFARPIPTENCDVIYRELYNAGNMAGMYISNLLSTLCPTREREHAWTQRAEKECVNSMNLLNKSLDSRSGDYVADGAKDLSEFMDRLVSCYVDEENRRTIFQTMLLYGLNQCVQTEFAFNLFRGSATVDPSLTLDNDGNTLMHLAVMSDTSYTWNSLFRMETRKNAFDATRKMNGLYWIFSVLLHRNNSGKLVIDTTSSSKNSFQDLKALFRAAAKYLQDQCKKFGCNDRQMMESGITPDFYFPSARVFNMSSKLAHVNLHHLPDVAAQNGHDGVMSVPRPGKN
eukprot:CAMPEP_0113845740 /NCGR_PEP_ID=MMETSP0372-20130328/926_1 /TAXON_ID=340204 /ORGANISM="Lankesteria abbotti" /LENGTH=367 /DNA_ID=CAMNT_0000814819 /DNA_START=94 /DNA_END=1197 /DNA_ORIENTATION=+ /assembly_acc=CAM_ASM_000359